MSITAAESNSNLERTDFGQKSERDVNALDTLLTEIGEEQVSHLGAKIQIAADEGLPIPDQVFTSVARRACQTAMGTWGNVVPAGQIHAVHVSLPPVLIHSTEIGRTDREGPSRLSEWSGVYSAITIVWARVYVPRYSLRRRHPPGGHALGCNWGYGIP